MSKKKKSSKAGMFILGSVVGAAAGMLFAQKKGSELREELVETVNVVKEKAVDTFERKEEIFENIKDNIESFKYHEDVVEYEEPEYYEKEFSIEKESEEDEETEKVNIVDSKEFVVEETKGE